MSADSRRCADNASGHMNGRTSMTHSCVTATMQCSDRAYIPDMWEMSTSGPCVQDRLKLQESGKAEHEC